MSQVLILLVVALVAGGVVFGVTALLTNSDPGMADAVPDGRAVPLPGDRPLVESDLTTVRFDVVLRGYRADQVDAAIGRLSYDMGYKQELIEVLESEVSALREGRTADADALREVRAKAVSLQPFPYGRGMTDLVVGQDGRARCHWALSAPEYLSYHDTEWGRPVHGDEPLYERLTLEAFQSGLSWITILRKRPAFRAAFAGFSLEKVAAFTDSDVERLLNDPGIVRNRAKITAAIGNARAALELPGGLSALLWNFAVDRPRPVTSADVPAITAESTAMAKALKKVGFTFFGPTTAYALMQATGMVNDHLVGCLRDVS